MSESKTDGSSTAEKIAKSVEKISDSKGLVAIGNGIGIGLAIFGFALMMAGVMFGVRWDGHFHPETSCFDIKEVSGKVYKINTCTGETSLIKTTEKKTK